MNLTPSEIAQLTGKARPVAQGRVLDSLGIPFRKRPDGTLVVLVDDVRGGAESKPRPTVKLRNAA